MKKRLFLVLSLVLTLVFLLGASTPVLAKKIVVLSQFPMSGVVGSLPEFGWGYIDGMNWVNGDGGGVNGKKITWFMEDFRYIPSVEIANFSRYAAEYGKDELLMATGYSTGALKPLIDKINKEEKIPWLDGSYSTEIFGKEQGGPEKYPYYYSLGATYGDQMKMLVKWIKDNYKGKGNPKLGLVYSPTSFGLDGTPEGIAYAKKIGVDVVSELELAMNATSAQNQVMALRKAKAQYVILHGYSGASGITAIFFKTAKKILKNVQIMGTHYTTSRFPILFAQEAYDGYIGISTRPFFDAVPRSDSKMDNPMVKFAHDFAKKYRPEEYKKGLKGGGIKEMFLYAEGLTYALMIQKALTDADNAGNLTREGVKNALDNMVWDFKGTFDGKTFAYKYHTIPMMIMYKAHVKMIKVNGKKVPTGGMTAITDWINTDEIKW